MDTTTVYAIQTATSGFVAVQADTLESAQLAVVKRDGTAVRNQIVWTADELAANDLLHPFEASATTVYAHGTFEIWNG